MKQEQKELLLKDLCARLPYGVVVKDRNGVHKLTPGNTEFIDLFNGKCNIAPYLLPLSSMTEEQMEEFNKLVGIALKDLQSSEQFSCMAIVAEIDFYHKYHFDYRGLIPMGLALDATGKNIY